MIVTSLMLVLDHHPPLKSKVVRNLWKENINTPSEGQIFLQLSTSEEIHPEIKEENNQHGYESFPACESPSPVEQLFQDVSCQKQKWLGCKSSNSQIRQLRNKDKTSKSSSSKCRYALRTQLWREMRKNVRLKTRKIARSDKKHPTKGVKGQTWKKAVMCFVKDLLRYQKKQKVKFTLYFQAKLLETTNLQGPVVQNGNYIHTYIHTLYWASLKRAFQHQY